MLFFMRFLSQPLDFAMFPALSEKKKKKQAKFCENQGISQKFLRNETKNRSQKTLSAIENKGFASFFTKYIDKQPAKA